MSSSPPKPTLRNNLVHDTPKEPHQETNDHDLTEIRTLQDNSNPSHPHTLRRPDPKPKKRKPPRLRVSKMSRDIGYEFPMWMTNTLKFLGIYKESNSHLARVWFYCAIIFILAFAVGSPMMNLRGVTNRTNGPTLDLPIQIVVLFCLTLTLSLYQHRVLCNFFVKGIAAELMRLAPVPHDLLVMHRRKEVLRFKVVFGLLVIVSSGAVIGVLISQSFVTWVDTLAVFLELCGIWWMCNPLFTIFFFAQSARLLEQGTIGVVRKMQRRQFRHVSELEHVLTALTRAVNLHSKFWREAWAVTFLQITILYLFMMTIAQITGSTNAERGATMAIATGVLAPIFAALLMHPARLNAYLQDILSLESLHMAATTRGGKENSTTTYSSYDDTDSDLDSPSTPGTPEGGSSHKLIIPSEGTAGGDQYGNLIGMITLMEFARKDLVWRIYGVAIDPSFVSRLVYLLISGTVILLSSSS